MCKIDLEKFICSLVRFTHEANGTAARMVETSLETALKEQGLKVEDGKIAKYTPWPKDCWEYLERNTHTPGASEKPYVYEDDAYDAVDLAKREMAQEIVNLCHTGKVKSVEDILFHCYGVMDF